MKSNFQMLVVHLKKNYKNIELALKSPTVDYIWAPGYRFETHSKEKP